MQKQYIFLYKLVVEHTTLPDTDRTAEQLRSMSANDL